MATLPLEYADLVCDDDLDPFATETTSTLQNLVQDVRHVLEEDLGSNPDDVQRGVGINSYLSGTSVQLATLPGVIETQLKRDDRVSACSCAISTQENATLPYLVKITLQVAGSVVPITFAWGPLAGLVEL